METSLNGADVGVPGVERREPWPFVPDRERYVNLATRRRDGTEVLTPMWLVGIDRRVFMYTAGRSGKITRLRRDPLARMAACSMLGVVHGEWIAVRSRFVEEKQLRDQVFRSMRHKYGWQIALADLLAWLSGRIRHRVVLEFEAMG